MLFKSTIRNEDSFVLLVSPGRILWIQGEKKERKENERKVRRNSASLFLRAKGILNKIRLY